MKELLSAELKNYIDENQDTLVKLLDTLCRVPAPFLNFTLPPLTVAVQGARGEFRAVSSSTHFSLLSEEEVVER